MLVDASNSTAGSAVTGAIRQAAQATGTSFQYLLATAKVESGLNPEAGASTSSARGLFQFIDQTWLATIKQAGDGLGYGQYAAAISKNGSGRYEVADPAMRAEILKLRNDPTANAVMAGAFTKANATALGERLGRAPSEGELYIAHFLGAGGAAQLITAASDNPEAKAASYFPDAANANASIFYDRSSGAARSLAQVRDLLTARYDVAARSGAESARAGSASASPPPIPPLPIPSVAAAANEPAGLAAPLESAAPASATDTVAPLTRPQPAAAAVPDTAGLTSAFAAAIPKRAADDSQVFHGLFTDPGRNGPVAAVVSQLWGGSNAGGNSAATPSASLLLDLFKDDGSRGA